MCISVSLCWNIFFIFFSWCTASKASATEAHQAAEPAKLSDTITAHFHGTLKDGAVFWSSVDMGEPLIINLAQLIPGCQKAISMMRPGDKWKVFIHPDLAYGEEGRPTIPPNAALVFDIELIKVDA